MHSSTLIWVIPAAATVIFAIISGWINIYAPNKGNDESIIRDQQKLIIKERLEMWKISSTGHFSPKSSVSVAPHLARTQPAP